VEVVIAITIDRKVVIHNTTTICSHVLKKAVIVVPMNRLELWLCQLFPEVSEVVIAITINGRVVKRW